MQKKCLSYGSWKSPITPDFIIKESVDLSFIYVDQNIYWLEKRPSEKGRSVVVKKEKGKKPQDLFSLEFNARTRVHEYGGICYLVDGKIIYFSNDKDQQLYKIEDGAPTAITDNRNMRFADGTIDPLRGYLYYVREEHFLDKEAKNTLVLIDPTTKTNGIIIASGFDFYAAPRVSPDGKFLAYICWNHPHMPWDESYLFIHPIKKDGSLEKGVKIAGGKNESIREPRWALNGVLYFIWDKSGFANIYTYDKKIEPVLLIEAEFGLPHWIFGQRTYDFVGSKENFFIVCTYILKGKHHLSTIKDGVLKEIKSPFITFDDLFIKEDVLYFIGGSFYEPSCLVALDLQSEKFQIIRKSSDEELDRRYIAAAELIEFQTEGQKNCYAYYYPPKNDDCRAINGEKPPLIVRSHGGPTSKASVKFNIEIQFFTSRGFAFVDVNYGGSSGFGREYQDRLKGKWGIVDVQDCVHVVNYLTNHKNIDKDKVIIRGRSAGGYTTLCALTFTDVFSAGASYYGICDLEALLKDTHKFESKYLENLIGPYPLEKQIYIQRSPIHYVQNLKCPVILLHGKEDKVVPVSQAEKMYNALLKKKIPVAMLLFEKEQHGFRDGENIKKALCAELYFYGKIFDFKSHEKLDEIPIINL